MDYFTNSTNEYRKNFIHACDEDAISILKGLLEQAESVEDYEECCILRDKINGLKGIE